MPTYSDNQTIEDKFYSISEVCIILGTDEHVLRHWETQFKQIQPQRQKGLRRLYSKEDVHILQYIKELLYNQQYSTKGAQKILSQYKRKDFIAGIPLKNSAERTPTPMSIIVNTIDSAIDRIDYILNEKV